MAGPFTHDAAETISDPMKITTAIHASVWASRFDAESLRPAVEKSATIGFDHLVVPLRRFEDIDPPAIAKIFSEHGLTPLNTAGVGEENDIGSPDADTRQKGIAHLTKGASLARDMGSQQINGVLYGPIGKRAAPSTRDALLRSAEAIGSVCRAASDMGVRLAIEMVNRYETNLLNTVEQGLEFIELCGAKNLFLHLDTFHMSIEESDPHSAIRNAFSKIGYFELDQSHRGYLDQGSLQLSGWLGQLKELDYCGIIGIEAFSASRMAPDHAAALAVWRDVFADGDRLARDGMQLIRAVFS